ncbi:hypothetical protein DERF_009691 [Dermatophagoides farinae]|uniref:Uncharacterized protein n=1 Tax=Dermatophagoides farinae TaxID=6954 RepID=A0A922HUG1_DERFA|nr:hypothetical protein DERF_009691 [Dermatophagoides farinae]
MDRLDKDIVSLLSTIHLLTIVSGACFFATRISPSMCKLYKYNNYGNYKYNNYSNYKYNNYSNYKYNNYITTNTTITQFYKYNNYKARLKVFEKRRIFVPKGNRCCSYHLIGKWLYEEHVGNIVIVSERCQMDENEMNIWPHKWD